MDEAQMEAPEGDTNDKEKDQSMDDQIDGNSTDSGGLANKDNDANEGEDDEESQEQDDDEATDSSPPSSSRSSHSSSSSKPKRISAGQKRARRSWDDSKSPKTHRKRPSYSTTNDILYDRSFLQSGRCPKDATITKCRECRWKDTGYCRFESFRKLAPKKTGALVVLGFLDPDTDPTEDDRNLWNVTEESQIADDMDLETAKLLIEQLGNQFCDLIQKENQALEIKSSENKTIAWKRVVKGVREMCDVCETTIFNYHWACEKCGFVVCIGCYTARKTNEIKENFHSVKQRNDRDEFQWLFCDRGNTKPHDVDKLMLTRFITGQSLMELGQLLHRMRHKWGIPQLCCCPEAQLYEPVAIENSAPVPSNGVVKSALNKKEASASSDEEQEEEDEDDDEDNAALMDLLASSESVGNGKENGHANGDTDSNSDKSLIMPIIDNESNGPDALKAINNSSASTTSDGNSLQYFVRSSTTKTYLKQLHPIRSMTLSESTILYPNAPHSWLCSGKLLRLTDPLNINNYPIFQDMWKRGQPVIVANIDRRLNKELWSPESFSRDYGEKLNDLVNCMTGKILANQPIKKFWDGFDYVNKRLLDEKGNPMLLKLKDWPPGEDFADVLPERFGDLMAALPLTDYTTRNGRMNLAARLPDNFVKPDLGPKMYIAYGSGLHLDKGTTNLHLDISDAVNVMVHVGVPKDCDNSEHMKAVSEAIEESDCDLVTIKKVKQNLGEAGALWHIYNSRDADKIRDLLNKVAKEKGIRLEPNHDPIHDQNWYLDPPLRKRLMNEYNVAGFPIVQCLGEAVFIPAGAPHQVRNLQNCIKIAEDFVSPENVSHCFDLTEEFRRLSDTHSNHEDKLQIKNIIYFSVKHALSVLTMKSKNGNDEPPVLEQQQNLENSMNDKAPTVSVSC